VGSASHRVAALIVGETVGEWVGAKVGTAVGAKVGTAVGSKVRSVGFCVGAAEHIPMGPVLEQTPPVQKQPLSTLFDSEPQQLDVMLQASLTKAVQNAVGKAVGALVGALEVGAVVGALVGVLVGVAVGGAVHIPMGPVLEQIPPVQ